LVRWLVVLARPRLGERIAAGDAEEIAAELRM
jgi:hypothetical protein